MMFTLLQFLLTSFSGFRKRRFYFIFSWFPQGKLQYTTWTKIITFPQILFDNVIERNSVVWIKTRNVSEDTWVTISNDSNPRRFEGMPTFSSNINPLACCHDGNRITWTKRSFFQKWKYKSVGFCFLWDLNRVRLLQTHLPGLRDSVVRLDLCQSISDWDSNVC